MPTGEHGGGSWRSTELIFDNMISAWRESTVFVYYSTRFCLKTALARLGRSGAYYIPTDPEPC